MEEFRLPLQPGEVSAENHRHGHGPALEMRDGPVHPAVARQAGNIAALSVLGAMSSEAQPDSTHSGPTFGGIAFGD